MFFLTWITQCVKQAVLKGFAEAIDELELQADESPDGTLDALKGRMTSLPAASSNGELKTTRKSK